MQLPSKFKLSACFTVLVSTLALSNLGLSETSARLIKLSALGNPLTKQNETYMQTPWLCVQDIHTGLIWEVKSPNQNLQYHYHSYSWYSENTLNNGGYAGYPDKGHCKFSRCDTQAYIAAINQKKLCQLNHWRLPTREELRSLADYNALFPGPTLDIHYFPFAVSQFYWSQTPSANNKDSAWGIGFTFGFDYAYFKSDAALVRAVHTGKKP